MTHSDLQGIGFDFHLFAFKTSVSKQHSQLSCPESGLSRSV